MATLTSRRMLLLFAALGVGVFSAIFIIVRVESQRRALASASIAKPASSPDGPSCERGVEAAKRGHLEAMPADSSPRSPSKNRPVPLGMVLIRGGEFWMGSDAPVFTDARPWHRVYLDPFLIDQTLVTNQQFSDFVKQTHYATLAELTPRAEDFPGAPPENLVAGSVVFSPPNHPVELNNHLQWWSYIKGAEWRHPHGPKSNLSGKAQHPVVQIAYADAEAYCTWQGKRLPTEAEFEFAERGGLDRKPYAWGEEFRPAEKFMANTFQGHFPDSNTADDGYVTTSPVGAFPANGYGLYDMSGNVWEWTSDWYRPDYYQTLAATGAVVHNPQGPADSLDPGEPGVPKKVHRGGSFLCTDQYCSRYMVGGRGKGEPDTGTNHLGFRCVLPVPVAEESRKVVALGTEAGAAQRGQ